MAKPKKHLLDFEVDKLTNSIENVLSGDSFATDITPLSKADLKKVTKKNGWLFNWAVEFKQGDRELFKLTIAQNPDIIQGLISLTVKEDNVYMHLIENAPFNRGKHKVYAGVPGNLVAFACKRSYDSGHEGYVSFLSKTALMDHYIKILGATAFGGNLMIINTNAANKLIDKYFKN